MDTGITPEFRSFNDDGFGPPPSKWKGSCDKFVNFSGCNKSEQSDILSPIDVSGHGTHTASTAAGSLVPNVSLFGLENGTARGASAFGKVSNLQSGEDSNYMKDSISIGAFHAMRKGIITVASAGNDGPTMATVVNKWIVTVAASGIERDFHSTVELGTRTNVSGEGINIFCPKQKQYPLVNGEDAARASSSKENAKTWSTEAIVKAIGGIDVPETFMAPVTFVNRSTGQIITNYIQSTRSPSAVIHKSHEVKIPAPFVASFSSRGPNLGSQHVLKPDITAPGISILAAYTLRQSIASLEGDTKI
ncbi:subtilisin protease SBT4.14 [Trifolium repens]|nr:subtilisin protease SBT4.14 [Trifolium repens]